MKVFDLKNPCYYILEPFARVKESIILPCCNVCRLFLKISLLMASMTGLSAASSKLFAVPTSLMSSISDERLFSHSERVKGKVLVITGPSLLLFAM